MYKDGAKSIEQIETSLFDLFVDERDVEKDQEKHKSIVQNLQQNPTAFKKMRTITQEKEHGTHTLFNYEVYEKLLSRVTSQQSMKIPSKKTR